MKELQRVFWVAVAFAAGAPALGAALQGHWSVTFLLLAAGGLWLAAYHHHRLAGWRWVLGMAGPVIAAWLGVAASWLLPGMVGALAAWDLDAFGGRVAHFSRVENERALTRAHLRRLGAVSGIGLVVGALGLLIRVQLSFGLALIVASLAVSGAVYLVYHLGRRQNKEGEDVTPSA